MTREVTKPSAKPSFCRLTTGNRVTAVPMPAERDDQLEEGAHEHAGVAAGAEDPGTGGCSTGP